MNNELTDQQKVTTPWVSAAYSLCAACAGEGYSVSQFATLIGKANEGVAEAELTQEFLGGVWIPIAILATALLAGILNIFFVMRGGRKWPLILSCLGILTSVLSMAFLALLWIKQSGR